MKIEVAKTAGFCFGVNRAVNMVYKLLDEGKKVATLGPIIHNPQVIEDLEKRGVKIVKEPTEAPLDSTLIIRTHGVPQDTVLCINTTIPDFCDATCPFVKKIHNIVKEHSDENSIVLIAGDENHPEVVGIRSYCKGESHIFQDFDELEILIEKNLYFHNKKIIVVAQTTFNTKEWQKCEKKIKLVYTNAIVFDTICSATGERQSEAIEISKRVDVMIIIGGRFSSNTAKLRDVCAENCRTYLIETAKELHQINFTGCVSIGFTAGASTPAGIIKEVLQTMAEILNENPTPIEEAQEAANPVAEEVPSKSIDEMSFTEALEESLKNMNSDQKVRGIVVGIAPNEIQVDIGRKHAGYIPLDEYTLDPNFNPMTDVKIGDELDLIIMKTNDLEGTVMLSKRRFDAIKAWDDIVEAEKTGAILEGVVTEVIRGGILVVTNGVKVFVPASLATESRNDNLEDLLKTKVNFRIIEIKAQRKRAVGSIRSVLKEARKEVEEAFWATAEVDKVYTGVVKSITSYGAFVDIGGVDGMVHISELSWKRIKHPSEVVSVGDTVEVYIKAIDKENKKISLGYKKIEDNPWEILKRDYPVGTVADVKIVGMTTFGAFAQIIPGIDGLIHISQIADRHINKPQDVLTVGDEVKAKLTEIDFEKKRVSLSIRALIEPQEEASTEETAEE